MVLAVEEGQLIAGQVVTYRNAIQGMFLKMMFANTKSLIGPNKMGFTFVRALILSVGLFLTSFAYAEGYICIPDKATGFKFNKADKSWNSTTFNVRNDKYVLSNSGGKWKWKPIGEKDYDLSKCSDFNEYGYMNCDSLGVQVTFNRKNLRYQSIYSVGYVSAGIAGAEGGDTPYIEIGRCSPI